MMLIGPVATNAHSGVWLPLCSPRRFLGQHGCRLRGLVHGPRQPHILFRGANGQKDAFRNNPDDPKLARKLARLKSFILLATHDP